MQVQNNKEEIPFAHYEEKFALLDPAEAAARCGVPFEDGAFTVTLLGSTYRIAWPEYAISSGDAHAFALKNLPCQTFLLRFLLEGRAAEPSGSYKTFREMPWGEMYIGPYTGRVLTRAAFTFGTRVEAFRAVCENMGALALPHGDAGFSRVELEQKLPDVPQRLSAELLNGLARGYAEALPEVERIGELTTHRRVKRFDGVELDLDRSEYFSRTDYELELEFTDEAAARELRQRLMLLADLPECGDVCPGKVRRFLAEYEKRR